MKFVNGFSASEASSHNTRNNSGIRVRFFSERSELAKYKKHQRFVFILSATAVENKKTTVKLMYGFSASEASSQNTRKISETVSHFFYVLKQRRVRVFRREKRVSKSRKKTTVKFVNGFF